MSSGFHRLNREILLRYIENGLDSLRTSFFNDVKEQTLYITEGAIEESIILEQTGVALKDQGLPTSALTISTIKGSSNVISSDSRANIKNQAAEIFRDLKKAARQLERMSDKVDVLLSQKAIYIVGTFRDITEAKRDLLGLLHGIRGTSLARKYLEMTDLGHAVGLGSIVAHNVRQFSNAIPGIIIPAEIQADIDFILDMEYDVGLDLHINKITGLRAPINLTLELSINRARGGATTRASERVRKWFSDNMYKHLLQSFNRLSNAELNKILTTKLSTSIEDDLREIFKANFLLKGKPAKSVRKNRKSTGSQKKRKTKTTKTTALKTGKKKSKKKKPPSLLENLLQLQSIINLKMHETLRKEVMGQGSDPVTLNYRTGRFARSAQLNQLIPRKGGLEAQITWQHFPYDTFAPGGKLHTPMRDPNFLIGQSIREILKEIGLQKIMISTRSNQ